MSQAKHGYAACFPLPKLMQVATLHAPMRTLTWFGLLACGVPLLPPTWQWAKEVFALLNLSRRLQTQCMHSNYGLDKGAWGAFEGGAATFCRVRAARTGLFDLSRPIIRHCISVAADCRLGIASSASSRDTNRCCSLQLKGPGRGGRYTGCHKISMV